MSRRWVIGIHSCWMRSPRLLSFMRSATWRRRRSASSSVRRCRGRQSLESRVRTQSRSQCARHCSRPASRNRRLRPCVPWHRPPRPRRDGSRTLSRSVRRLVAGTGASTHLWRRPGGAARRRGSRHRRARSGTCGARVPPDEFLPTLRARCDEAGALLVVDAIFTGLGRIGEMWPGSDVADVVCVGKALGGGLPLSAALFVRPKTRAGVGLRPRRSVHAHAQRQSTCLRGRARRS